MADDQKVYWRVNLVNFVRGGQPVQREFVTVHFMDNGWLLASNGDGSSARYYPPTQVLSVERI